MTDTSDVQAQIDVFEAEREALRRREAGNDPTREDDVRRVEAIRIELDRLWDLKRQQQARRDAGEDPGGASERPAQTVESYEQ